MGQSKEEVVVLAILFLILPIIAVVLRFWAKAIKQIRPTADDYMIIPALIFTLGTGTCQLVAAFDGHLGQHVHLGPNEIPVELPQILIFLKSEYAFEILAQLAIICAKFSLLLLYRRIFITRIFKIATIIVGTIILIWHGSFILAFIFQCTPVTAAWNPMAPPSQCIDKIRLWLAYAVSDILTDTIVLSMPAPAVWQLRMPTRQKVAVSGTFLLGALVVASGITRTIFFFKAAKTPQYDATYYAAPAVYWSFIETSLAVVSACLPTLRPIFEGFSPISLLYNLRSKLSLSSERKLRGFSQQHLSDNASTSSVAAITAKDETNVNDYTGQKPRSYQARAEEFAMVNTTGEMLS